jgi:hypothetical protein
MKWREWQERLEVRGGRREVAGGRREVAGGRMMREILFLHFEFEMK